MSCMILKSFRNFAANEKEKLRYKMITTVTNTTQFDSFTLELPKADTTLLKALAKKMGWTMRHNRRKMSSYERSLDDAANGRINEYASADEFFKKMGI